MGLRRLTVLYTVGDNFHHTAPINQSLEVSSRIQNKRQEITADHLRLVWTNSWREIRDKLAPKWQREKKAQDKVVITILVVGLICNASHSYFSLFNTTSLPSPSSPAHRPLDGRHPAIRNLAPSGGHARCSHGQETCTYIRPTTTTNPIFEKHWPNP
jgi:hypothetical protein